MSRLCAGVLGIALLAGCNDDPTGREGAENPRPEVPSSEVTGDVLATQRIVLDVRATGAFRPGAPIVVSSSARAKYEASAIEYHLIVLDDDGTAQVDEREGGRAVANFRGRMDRGNQQQLTATITFSRPGYYRVIALAKARPAPEEAQFAGDSVLLDLTSETLYILVDEPGGRLTTGYDRAALAGRTPLRGSFGPFVSRASRARSNQGRPGQNTASLAAGYHVLQYANRNLSANPDGSYPPRPVPNAEVVFTCLDYSFQPTTTASTFTASDGSFSISCPTGYYDATAHLRNEYANVMYPDRGPAGVWRFGEYSETYLAVENDHAGHVHVLLNRYVPKAQQRFGRRRTQLAVLVNNNPSAAPADTATNYFQNEDVVRQNYTKVFGEYGMFVTVHEYGHAYHWKAVEPPSSYGCTSENTHTLAGEINHNCAFVEGFADFFSSLLTGDSLYYGPYSDYKLETQTYFRNADGTKKDGSKVEGAFAGFLYDLVDGPGDFDAVGNTSAMDDSFDNVQYPGSFIVNTMEKCYLNDGINPHEKLWGTPDFVYCIENTLSARTEASRLGYSWGTFQVVDRRVIDPAGYDFNAVRRLWKRNLYDAL